MQPWVAALLGDLQALPESEAAQLIVQALAARPALAQPVVAAVCPSLAYAPSKALTECRMVGHIKSFNPSTGYGFISCPELYPRFGSDVFLHKAQIGSFVVHQEVSFAVLLNKYNKPQAYDLALPHTPSAAGPPCDEASDAAVAAAAALAAAASAVRPAPLQWAPPAALRDPAQRPSPPVVDPASVVLVPAWMQPQERQQEAARVDGPGCYRVLQHVPVTPTQAPCLEEDAMAFLRPGTCVHALQVAFDADRMLVQVRLESPPGWIRVLHTASGFRWAKKQDEPSTPSLVGRRFAGQIKSFNRANGFGFIACQELRKHFDRDVYLRSAQLQGLAVGQEVSFELLLNSQGHPQAKELRPLSDGSSSCSSSADGGLDRSSEGRGPAPPPPGDGRAKGEPAQRDVDDLFEGAMCAICQEVMHRPASVQPCMHSFCSSCVSRWLRTAPPLGEPPCPVCRETVVGVARNSTLEGIIDGLLRAHPERRRPPEEIEDLDRQDSLSLVQRVFAITSVLPPTQLGPRRSHDDLPSVTAPFWAESPGTPPPWEMDEEHFLRRRPSYEGFLYGGGGSEDSDDGTNPWSDIASDGRDPLGDYDDLLGFPPRFVPTSLSWLDEGGALPWSELLARGA